jgi:hypothetical protein
MAKENAFLVRFKIKGGFKKLDFNGFSLIRTPIIYEIFNNIKISNILVFCNFYITKILSVRIMKLKYSKFITQSFKKIG